MQVDVTSTEVGLIKQIKCLGLFQALHLFSEHVEMGEIQRNTNMTPTTPWTIPVQVTGG